LIMMIFSALVSIVADKKLMASILRKLYLVRSLPDITEFKM